MLYSPYGNNYAYYPIRYNWLTWNPWGYYRPVYGNWGSRYPQRNNWYY